jgi:hypothetical protein
MGCCYYLSIIENDVLGNNNGLLFSYVSGNFVQLPEIHWMKSSNQKGS